MEFFGWPHVWLITSTDQDLKTHHIAIVTTEETANAMTEALDAADTEGTYSYEARKMQVLR